MTSLQFIVSKAKGLVEVANQFDRAGVNQGRKVSKNGKVFLGREYAGQTGDIIFVPDLESYEKQLEDDQ